MQFQCHPIGFDRITNKMLNTLFLLLAPVSRTQSLYYKYILCICVILHVNVWARLCCVVSHIWRGNDLL